MLTLNLKDYQRVIYWTRLERNEWGGYKKRYGRLIEPCPEFPRDHPDQPFCLREVIMDEETGEEVIVDPRDSNGVMYKFANETNDPYALF